MQQKNRSCFDIHSVRLCIFIGELSVLILMTSVANTCYVVMLVVVVVVVVVSRLCLQIVGLNMCTTIYNSQLFKKHLFIINSF